MVLLMLVLLYAKLIQYVSDFVFCNILSVNRFNEYRFQFIDKLKQLHRELIITLIVLLESFHIHLDHMVWLLQIFMSHHHHRIKQFKPHPTISPVNRIKRFTLPFCINTSICYALETYMFVSPAPAPYDGVYQRQPTGLPNAEFVPQYSPAPSAPQASSDNPYLRQQGPATQYPPQTAYQNTHSDSMYVPPMNPYSQVSRSKPIINSCSQCSHSFMPFFKNL